MASKKLVDTLTFGFEQTFTTPDWWTTPGFTSVSDTPLKREKMLELATHIASTLGGSFKESVDIWNHMQYETFTATGDPSFVVTMDPGSIEVKTWPCLAHEVEKMAVPLFKAAQLANLVAYRNWWYGIQGGTEGGCHVNMGGRTPATNPLKKNPELVVQYAAYLHNRPWLTYPFQSLDVGPGGNAVRLDEKSDFEEVKQAFTAYAELMKAGKVPNATGTYDHFKHTSIVTEKGSAPSMAKFKEPDFLVEDRAQEALRSPEDFKLVTDLRIRILEMLVLTKDLEPLETIPDLHGRMLTSYYLWEKFQKWANSIEVNPVSYQRFFDRQFPKLLQGKNPPKRFGIKEGRRPRVITGIQKRGDVVTSKTIDTRFKRFELYYYTQKAEAFDFVIEANGMELQSPLYVHESHLGFGDMGTPHYCYFDIKLDTEAPRILIKLIEKKGSKVLETATFNANDMMWE